MREVAMSQLTLYLPDEEARAIRKAARTDKRSVSEWARGRMAESLRSTWPEGCRAVFGAIKDDTLRRPVQPSVGKDVKRSAI
jgi:hypothetical protein